jgi:hypothetical protein
MKKILLLTMMFSVTLYTSAQRTASTSGNWNATATWGGSSVPTSGDAVTLTGFTVTIPNGYAAAAASVTCTGGNLVIEGTLTSAGDIVYAGNVTLSNNGNMTTAGDLTYNSGTLTINTGSYVKLSNSSKTFTNNGSVVCRANSNDFSSIINAGSFSQNEFTGLGTFEKYIHSGDASSGWELAGSPVVTVTAAAMWTANQSVFTTNSGDFAIGAYNSTDNSWDNYATSATTILNIGQGYQMASVDGGVVTFSGSLNNGDITRAIQNYDLDNDADMSDGSRFNLVSNPYYSFIHANDNTDSTNNLISINASVLHDNGQALYYWNGSSYDIVNHATTTFRQYVAPVQGFFIMAKTTGSSTNFSFTRAMQTSVGTDDAIVGDIVNDDNAELFLKISQNSSEINTEIYFSEYGTDNLDPGYDAQSFSTLDTYISTRLIETIESTDGVDFGIQSLSFENMLGKTIPLSVNALSGIEATISISHNTTYASTYVYLEDALEGTFTNLKETNFVITPDSDLQGAGRFFIHTSSTTMSNEDESTNLLNVFKLQNNNFITVEGLAVQSTVTSVKLYSILGVEVLSTILNNNTNTQTISTNGLSTGIYVIKLQSGNNLLTKKFIIK